jgi:hypothetical protein
MPISPTGLSLDWIEETARDKCGALPSDHAFRNLEQPPGSRDTLELCGAPILESDVGTGNKIPARLGDENLSRSRPRCDARTNMDRYAADLPINYRADRGSRRLSRSGPSLHRPQRSSGGRRTNGELGSTKADWWQRWPWPMIQQEEPVLGRASRRLRKRACPYRIGAAVRVGAPAPRTRRWRR